MVRRQLKIEKLAKKLYPLDNKKDKEYNTTSYNLQEAFYFGATSQEAKEYHTKGMYSKNELIEYAKLALQNNGDKLTSIGFLWTEQNVEWFNNNKK